MHLRTNSTEFINYKLRGRRDSILTLKNVKIGEESNFIPVEVIFSNKHTLVRRFENEAGESLAVKSMTTPISRSECSGFSEFKKKSAEAEHDITQEYNLFKQVYPEAQCYLEAGLYTYPTGDEWTYRFIMPFITEPTLDKYICNIDDPITYLSLILAIVLEIKRIHNLGILHGDIYYNNIFASRRSDNPVLSFVQYIDFGCSYSIYDESATLTTSQNKNRLRWAPERWGDSRFETLRPNSKQDVYSLGYMLIDLMDENLKFGRTSFSYQFPCLFKSINKTQADEPSERPDLNEIVNSINNDLAMLR